MALDQSYATYDKSADGTLDTISEKSLAHVLATLHHLIGAVLWKSAVSTIARLSWNHAPRSLQLTFHAKHALAQLLRGVANIYWYTFMSSRHGEQTHYTYAPSLHCDTLKVKGYN